MKIRTTILLIFLVLLADQALKIYIKTSMILNTAHTIAGDWFYIHFTENNGMAFGMEIEGMGGKLFLSIFRILAISGITWWLYDLFKKKATSGLIISVSLIWAGAVGNMIDSAFYGLLFNDSNASVAQLFPIEGGYSSFLQGKVVDMFYFPIIEGHFPDWMPIWANQNFTFFSPVFNLADASITTGVFMIILFQKKYFPKEEELIHTSLSGIDDIDEKNN